LKIYNTIIFLLLLPLCGCYKPLFPKNEARTQFQDYDLIREGYQPMVAPDPFGQPEPALRGRLLYEE
tara:strand:- start:115 stop:315 length:201 start_codon:yes stop_codon:yes gene_type:complete